MPYKWIPGEGTGNVWHKMEAAEPSVSLDLLIRALLALDVTRKELGQLLSSAA
jgi:hypothetical protein